MVAFINIIRWNCAGQFGGHQFIANRAKMLILFRRWRGLLTFEFFLSVFFGVAFFEVSVFDLRIFAACLAASLFSGDVILSFLIGLPPRFNKLINFKGGTNFKGGQSSFNIECMVWHQKETKNSCCSAAINKMMECYRQ